MPQNKPSFVPLSPSLPPPHLPHPLPPSLRQPLPLSPPHTRPSLPPRCPPPLHPALSLSLRRTPSLRRPRPLSRRPHATSHPVDNRAATSLYPSARAGPGLLPSVTSAQCRAAPLSARTAPGLGPVSRRPGPRHAASHPVVPPPPSLSLSLSLTVCLQCRPGVLRRASELSSAAPLSSAPPAATNIAPPLRLLATHTISPASTTSTSTTSTASTPPSPSRIRLVSSRNWWRSGR